MNFRSSALLLSLTLIIAYIVFELKFEGRHRLTHLLSIGFVDDSCSKINSIHYSAKHSDNIQDLQFIYNTILENHPGIYNAQDPNFRKHLENSYMTAKLKIQKSNNNDEGRAAINEFTNSFNDKHLWINWIDKAAPKQIAPLRQIGASELANNIIWATIPTFEFTTQQSKAFETLVKQMTQLQNCNYVIFDLRGNQGGNSAYGDQLVEALFGEQYAAHKRYLYNKNTYVEWRASTGNLRHVEMLQAKYPESQWLQKVRDGLQQSIQQGQNLYRENSTNLEKLPEKSILNKNPQLKIIIITESVNVSAALDFIDAVKMMTKHVTLIGQKTKADRLYMEVRPISLPSDRGEFWWPIKVYRHRPRADNQPYVPDIEFTHIEDTIALQEMILTKIRAKEL